MNDSIKCALCEHVGKSISAHVKREHGLEKAEYEKKFGPTLSEASRLRYRELGKENCKYIIPFNQKSEEEKETIRRKVSESIKSNKAEISRRSEQMKAWNKSPEGRSVASKTAKKTSSREEVLLARSRALKRWRDENREEFFEKCVKPLTSSFKSHAEKSLNKFLQEEFGFFQWGSQIKSELFSINQTCRKQVDFLAQKERVIVEFDGPHHFFSDELSSKKGFHAKRERVAKLDEALKIFSQEANYLLVRVAWSCYDQHRKQIKEEILLKIKDKISAFLKGEISPGLYTFGEEYNG